LRPATEFVPATALFQANSCQQGERHRSAVFSAAEHLNDGSLQTNQFVAGHGFPATGSILPGPSIWGPFSMPQNKNPCRGTGATLKGEHALYLVYPILLGLHVGD